MLKVLLLICKLADPCTPETALAKIYSPQLQSRWFCDTDAKLSSDGHYRRYVCVEEF